MENQGDCCRDIFADFTFEEISRAQPPNKKGVYCIKIQKRGIPTDEIEKNRIPHLQPSLGDGARIPSR